MAGVVAGAVVDQREGVHRARLAIDPHAAVRAHGRALAGPGEAAAVGRDDLDRLAAGVVEEPEVHLDGSIPDPDVVRTEVDPAAPEPGPLVQAVAVALPHRPPALRQGADAHHADAEHEVRRVDADVAPALEHSPTAKQRHSPGRERDVSGPIGPGSAERQLRAHSAGAVILGID